MTSPAIRVRGIRTPLPTGYVLGRISPGTGDTELIAIADLAARVGQTGQVAIPSAISPPLTFVAPAAGLTITPSGSTVTFALANDLAALEAMAGTGLVVRTAAETYAQRTITGTANSIDVTNGSGVAGNPTLAISASPALTGVPTSPTAAPGTNTTQIATTAFVTAAAVASVAGTINKLAKFTAANAVGDSSVSDDGNTVFSSLNSAGDLPASTATAGWALSSNYGGDGVVNYWSTVPVASGSNLGGHNFRQRLVGDIDIDLAYLYGDDTFTEMDMVSGGAVFFFGVNTGSDGFSGSFSNHPFGLYVNNIQRLNIPTTGGIEVRDTSAAFNVTLLPTSSPALSASRTLTLDMSNVAHTLDLGATANTITFPSAASYTVAGLSVAGTWSATQTSMTLDTTTLSGLTTLPDSGQITAAGELGLGATPLARLHLGGTYTTANAQLINIGAVLASSITAFQRILNFTPTYAPTGASLTTIETIRLAPTLNSTAFTITVYRGVVSELTLGASFTGTVATCNMFTAADPTITNNPITNFNGFFTANLSNGNGITSGSVTNRAFRAVNITAAAGAGGTITNEEFSLAMPTGSSAGTTNYGIRITGNGGALSTNFALHSSSTAPIQIGGMFQFLGATASFPALKRSTTTLQVRLADDSGDASLSALYLRPSVGNALTAVGTNRATALQLAAQINNVTTAAAGTGVLLPVGVVGMEIEIFNAGANLIKVYATASETIDTVAGSTGVNLTNALRCRYRFVAANTWISAQMGVISA